MEHYSADREDREDREDLILDPPVLQDVSAIHEIYSDARVWGHFPSGRHVKVDSTESLIRYWISVWERDGLGPWIIRDKATGEVLGNAGCDLRHGLFWNVGYRLAVTAQGRGIATSVSAESMRRARILRPNTPTVAYLVEHNFASAKVAEKLGMALQNKCPDMGNPNPKIQRLIYADRQLSPEELSAAQR